MGQWDQEFNPKPGVISGRMTAREEVGGRVIVLPTGVEGAPLGK